MAGDTMTAKLSVLTNLPWRKADQVKPAVYARYDRSAPCLVVTKQQAKGPRLVAPRLHLAVYAPTGKWHQLDLAQQKLGEELPSPAALWLDVSEWTLAALLHHYETRQTVSRQPL